jgi:hypothetical protein
LITFTNKGGGDDDDLPIFNFSGNIQNKNKKIKRNFAYEIMEDLLDNIELNYYQ